MEYLLLENAVPIIGKYNVRRHVTHRWPIVRNETSIESITQLFYGRLRNIWGTAKFPLSAPWAHERTNI